LTTRERRRLDLALDQRVDDLLRGAAIQPLPDRDLVEHDAEREDVAAVIDVLARRLLRRHVAELAGQHLGARVLAARARDPEIDHLHEAVLRDEQVRRRDIEVDDVERLAGQRRAFRAALRVKIAQPRGRLADQLDRVLERQEPAVRDAAPAQLVELLTDDVLHRDVRDAVVLVDVVDVHDVGVVELRADLRLVEEHLDDPRIIGELRAQLLDHDFLLEAGHRRLARQIDLRHTADREPAQQRVAPAELHRLEIRGAVARHVTPRCAASVPSIAARTSEGSGGNAAGSITAGCGATSAFSVAVMPPPRPSRS